MSSSNILKINEVLYGDFVDDGVGVGIKIRNLKLTSSHGIGVGVGLKSQSKYASKSNGNFTGVGVGVGQIPTVKLLESKLGHVSVQGYDPPSKQSPPGIVPSDKHQRKPLK